MDESKRSDDLKALIFLFGEVGRATLQNDLVAAEGHFERALAQVASGKFKVDSRMVAREALEAFRLLAAEKVDASARPDDRRCRVCGKGEPYVKRLLVGHSMYICDEDVRLFAKILGELEEPDAQ